MLPISRRSLFEAVAAFPLVYLTACTWWPAAPSLRPGETILVHAAGAGVSTAAIQIARLLGAGRVIATIRTRQGTQGPARRGPTT